MPSKPPDDPPSNKPGDPSLKPPKETSSKEKKSKKDDKLSPTKKYIQLIERISRGSKSDKDAANEENTFDVKRKVEVQRPHEEELKRKLSELSSKLEKLKTDTKSVLSETSSKIEKLETSTKQHEGKTSGKETNVKEKKPFKDPLPQSLKGISGQSFISRIQLFLKGFRSDGKSSPPQKGPKMSAPGRPMKFAYTYSARIAQFPLKFYIKNNWMWKYYFIAVAVSFPVFYKLGRLSNAPENVKKWEEIRKRDFTPGGHH